MAVHESTTKIAGLEVPQRTTWIPKTEIRVRSTPSVAECSSSHINGAPLLTDAAPCPHCGHCGQPMQLMVQLFASDDPRSPEESLPDGSCLQAFWCPSDCFLEDGLGARNPFASAARLIVAGDHVSGGDAAKLPLAVSDIVGWEASLSAPHCMDDLLFGHEASADLPDEWIDEYSAHDRVADSRTRLSGFPWLCNGSWNVEASCEECGRPMDMVLQIALESTDAAGFGGNAWILMCAEHPWAPILRWGIDG